LLDAVKAIKAKGYTLALDDFDFDPKWQAFYPYIDIIKVDVLQFTILEIFQFVNTILHLKVTLLAEKVESSKHFEQLKMLGFTLFQGYFFARPEMMKQKKVTTTKHGVLELISFNINKIAFHQTKQVLFDVQQSNLRLKVRERLLFFH
jgi:EAL and modified HD-GYP domain-containing signal transduction protein